MSSKRITSREYGLVFVQPLLNYIVGTRALHYGLWEEGVDVSFSNLNRALTAYSEFLLGHIPDGSKTVLDVGCGVGDLASRMKEMNLDVECLSPSVLLNEEARAFLGDVLVHDTRFEDFESDRQFDLLVFSESFQYVKLSEVFSKCCDLLNPHGHVLICDKFRMTERGQSPIGGGHGYSKYLNQMKKDGFEIVSDIDMTNQIAPTFDLIQDFCQKVLKPTAEKAEHIWRANHPLLMKLFWGRVARKFAKQLHPERNARGFRDYNCYRLQVLQQRQA